MRLFLYVLVSIPLLLTFPPASAQDSTFTRIDSTQNGVALLLSGLTPEERERFMRRWRFVTGALIDIRTGQTDTSVNFTLRSQPLALTREELEQIRPPRDFVGEELYRRQLGTVPPLDLNPLMQSGAQLLAKAISSRKRPGRITTTPSPLEADVLAMLWRNGPATQGDIYASLDTVWRITAQDLDHLLAQMVKKGLLDRKKISPENTFTILTPVGAMAIEKSSLNRKNVNYLYWPIIDRRKLITYLDAQLYLASSAAPVAGDGRAASYQRALLETLYRLSVSATP